MSAGIFVTGTDTGVGKTYAACALLAALRARGVDVAPMKPVAAGAEEAGGRWINEDTAALVAASGRDASWSELVTPCLLREPMAPHIAADREGRAIDLAPVQAAFAELRRRAAFVVVEGVGGFRVPLTDALDTVDLARSFALPVVLVVGMRLGCLNHALLTRDAIEAAGLPLAGWIANTLDPAMPVLDENVAALQSRLAAPLLGRLPHAPGSSPAGAARHLDVGALL